MKRILLTIEYKGTNYSGWQIQNGLSTVQGELTSVLERICGHPVKLCGSGRTDEGVHALGQTAHFDCNADLPDEKFPFICNPLLPPDIKILKSQRVSDGFHARFDAKKKTYIYKMYVSRTISPLREGYYAHIILPPNIEAMKKACLSLKGVHDFNAFAASGTEVKTTVREIFFAEISATNDEIYFEICGNGFLHNMVRIIVGTLLDIGRGRLNADDMARIIESGDRTKAGFTANACGLYLKSVEY